jgi:hypothetical protein
MCVSPSRGPTISGASDGRATRLTVTEQARRAIPCVRGA